MMNYRLKTLKECLNNLAAPTSVQLQYLKDSHLRGAVDELALEFDDVVGDPGIMFEVGEITAQQCACLTKLDGHLSSFSGESNAHLWTEEALYSANEWKEVRRLAKECLELFE